MEELGVKYFPELTIDFSTEENLKAGAKKVVGFIRPDWPQQEFQYKIFTDGISNKLLGVYLPANKADMILVRVYGAKTELIIDRDSEIRNMLALHKANNDTFKA